MSHRYMRLTSAFAAFATLCLLILPIDAAAPDIPLIYTLRIRAVHPETVASLNVGAPLIDRVGKYAIGRVGEVTVAPHMMETYSADADRMVSVPHPELLDVTLTVRAQGHPDGTAYRVSGYLLTPGTTVSFTMPFFSGIGECTATLPMSDVT